MKSEVIILAAGKGTRMVSSLPKPLHPLMGKPIIEFVLDAIQPVCDAPPVIVIGHSMGGRNALFYTVCRPWEVARLILVDARPSDNPEASKALRRLIMGLPLRAKSLDVVVNAIRRLYPYLSLNICEHIARYGYKIKDGALVPRYDTRMANLLEKSKFAAEPLGDLIKNVTCPTLIVRGEESPFLSRQETQDMCKIMSRAEWREIPKSTHLPVQENPTGFERVVREFLSL